MLVSIFIIERWFIICIDDLSISYGKLECPTKRNNIVFSGITVSLITIYSNLFTSIGRIRLRVPSFHGHVSFLHIIWLNHCIDCVNCRTMWDVLQLDESP